MSDSEISAEAGAGDGVLSVEDAVSMLDAPVRRRPQAADDGVPSVEPSTDDTRDEEADADASAAADTDDNGGEDGEDEPADQPAIEPPTSWDAEARARFAQLPRADQEYLVGREQQRERAVNAALQTAAQARKAAEGEAAQIQRYKPALDQLLTQAAQTFAGKWERVDWAQFARQDPAACYQAEKEYQAEKAQLQQLHAAQQSVDEANYQRFVQTEVARLPELAPDLADPDKGPERSRQLTGFLHSMGISRADLKAAGAAHLAIAYDAMRYRQLQAQARAGITAKPAAPAGKPLRPAAAQGGNSQTRSASAARTRFSQTRSIDDAVALLDSRT